jgi:superfamily II DNA or RNA helicase
LIDELEQFSQLLPLLRYEVGFAHGGVNKTNKDKVPLKYHKSDPKALVQDFNDGKFPILIGTSCIRVGTDIRSVKQCIYLCGGKSEVEVKQSVGRTTRLVPGKEDCVFIDFGIENVPTLKKHAEARRKIYDDIYPSFKLIQQ